jgi:redox-sensing transcriptional repressor
MNREEDKLATSSGEAKLSRAAAGRLSLYLRRLEALVRDNVETISSGQFGQALGVSDAQVRKDLAALGHLGQPGVGYHPGELISVIRRVLGLDRSWPVVLVGVGNLARALLRYQGFSKQGFRVVAVFDSDPGKIGQLLDSWTIEPPARLGPVVAETRAKLGIITVPAEVAQSVADQLVAAGIRGILNFAPLILKVLSGVSLVSVDLTIQLEQLAFMVQSETGDGSLLSVAPE